MALVVIEHVLDENAGVYRVVIGQEVSDQVPDPDTGELVDVVHHEHVAEIVFAADDPRWKTARGRRRSANAVADEQRQIILDHLDERARQAETADAERDAAIKPLPGGGTPL